MLLSIIIPSFNHEQFVINTLKAADRIEIDDKEIIVIDDGSSDSSVLVIRDFLASDDAKVKFTLITRENRGLVKTLNQGLAIASGKYVYIVASDDIPIPAGICSLVSLLESRETLQFALGNALMMDSEYQSEFIPTYGEAHRRFFALPYNKRHKELFLRYPNPLLLQATVFRSSILKDIGGWREDIISDDLSLFLRLLSQLRNVGTDFVFQPQILACFYRQHGANISKNQERQFKTVGQALMHLCPVELKDSVSIRHYADISITAVKNRRLLLAARLFYSRIDDLGLFRWLRAAGPAFEAFFMIRISRALSHTALVEHEPAISMISNSNR
jgi:glycosyltransferase involved in cell wall biosynthesis